MAILSSIYSLVTSLLSPTSNLEHVGQQVLESKAVPGLMTVLDIALQGARAYELTGTLTTSHAVLAAVLDVKTQARLVIDLIRKQQATSTVIAVTVMQQQQQQPQQSNKVVVESFARACLDAASDMMQVLSTDSLAETANLSDPYEHMNSNNNNNTSVQQQLSHNEQSAVDQDATTALPPSPIAAGLTAPSSLSDPSNDDDDDDEDDDDDHSNSKKGRKNKAKSKTDATAATTNTNNDEWWKALNGSIHDTGRRTPLAQRPRDLWETARLHCVDYMWAEQVLQSAQRTLRHLVKHPLVSEVNHHSSQAHNHHHAAANAYHHRARGSGSGSGALYAPTLVNFSTTVQDEILVLLQLIQVDLPVRLLQFRAAALEHEAVVLKHLYLLKCECRAPFRAFLEAHQSVLKAPPLATVQGRCDAVAAARKQKEQEDGKRRRAKDKLQKLLETPQLVDCLTLEQTSQHLEIEISKALYPFCELARYLDHKRASVVRPAADTMELQVLLHRCKGLLTRKSAGHDSSAGIRPLLMDLQRVPREDELKQKQQQRQRQMSPTVSDEEWQTQVERLIQQLQLLNECCRTRGSFRSDKKADVEAPSVVVERCARLDVELFRCHCLDWYTVVEQQQQIECDWDALAEEIRQAELEVSLASVGTKESLQLLSQRLRVLEQDRESRFRVLAEILEDIGRRELNLLIKLEPPEERQVLTLRPTSAKGVFGIPLEMAGETLPIG